MARTNGRSRSITRRLDWRAVGVVVAAGAATVVVSQKPWQPLRYGRMEPPAPDLAGLEAPLVRRIETLTAAVRDDPYDAGAWGRLGVVYEVHDLPRQAVACYQRAARLDRGDFRWPYFLGLTVEQTDHQAGLDALRRAGAINAGYAPLQLHLAEAFFDAGDLDQARAHAERAAALDRALVRPYIDLARVALARDDARAALGALREATARGPKGGEVHFLLAETYRRLGEEDAARRERGLAGRRVQFEGYPDRVRAEAQWAAGVTSFWHRTRARRYLEEGMADRAAAEWTAVLRDNPRSVEALTELGRIFRAGGQPRRAIGVLRRALAIDGDLAGPRHLLGQILFGEGREEEGLAEMQRSLAGMPGNAAARANVARALDHLDRRGEAAPLWFAAGELLLAAGRGGRATKAFEAGAADWNAAGQPGEALAALERARQRAPEPQRGRFDALIETARRRPPPPPAGAEDRGP